MAAGHGGARPGSGRKPKATTDTQKPTTRYNDALAYLEAVVRGDEPADGLRIAAAKAVLPFQAPKARAPVESPPPKTLRRKVETGLAAVERDAWLQTEAAIRARHKPN